jgi:hypothetical protein
MLVLAPITRSMRAPVATRHRSGRRQAGIRMSPSPAARRNYTTASVVWMGIARMSGTAIDSGLSEGARRRVGEGQGEIWKKCLERRRELAIHRNTLLLNKG